MLRSQTHIKQKVFIACAKYECIYFPHLHHYNHCVLQKHNIQWCIRSLSVNCKKIKSKKSTGWLEFWLCFICVWKYVEFTYEDPPHISEQTLLLLNMPWEFFCLLFVWTQFSHFVLEAWYWCHHRSPTQNEQKALKWRFALFAFGPYY